MCSVNHTSNNNTVILADSSPSASTIRAYFAGTNIGIYKIAASVCLPNLATDKRMCIFSYNFPCMPAYTLWIFPNFFIFSYHSYPFENLIHGDRIICMGPWNPIKQTYINRIGILSLISMCVLWKLIIDSFTNFLMYNPQSRNKSRAVQYITDYANMVNIHH